MSKIIKITLCDEMEEFLNERAKSKNLSVEEVVVEIIKAQINSKVFFEEGFYFDVQKNKLYNGEGKVIEFTKLQQGLFSLLLERKNQIVDFETIHNEVWKDRKMSIFTMRNVIKRIRDLTYYGIIINHSNKGYSIGNIQ